MTAHGSQKWKVGMSKSNQDGYYGAASAGDVSTEFGAMSFLVNQILDGRNTATLVEVKGVTNAGGLEPVGFVDVLPLVNQLDGEGNAVPHLVVYRLPYFRIQGGANAIILDPQVGDIGLAVFADRDISAVKASRAAANPGSLRRANKADGLFICGFLNSAPSQYVQFTDAGINVVSPTKISFSAPAIESSGAWAHSGTIKNNGKDIGSTHTHSGITPGGSNTGGPV
jgi:hypothetical protein